MNLIDKLRLMQVKRYPICHVNREQSVAEHSFNVTLIAVELARVTRDQNLINEVVAYAISHDIEEVYTGDIPSSFKRQLRAECPSVSPLLDGYPDRASDAVKAIVKLADYLEAIYYIKEFGGSRQAENVVLGDIMNNFEVACQTSKAPSEVVNLALAIYRAI